MKHRITPPKKMDANDNNHDHEITQMKTYVELQAMQSDSTKKIETIKSEIYLQLMTN